MRNYSEFIKCPRKRILTAKGYKFLSRCVDVACKNLGYTRYHAEVKEMKNNLKNLIVHLFIDKGLNDKEIVEIIKNRTIKNGIN